MMDTSLLVSVGLAFLTYVSVFITMKNKTDQHTEEIKAIRANAVAHHKEDSNTHDTMYIKIDKLNSEVAEHKVRLANAPTMEQARMEFVSKEMFKQMEKHIDEKFDRVELGIASILDKLK